MEGCLSSSLSPAGARLLGILHAVKTVLWLSLMRSWVTPSAHTVTTFTWRLLCICDMVLSSPATGPVKRPSSSGDLHCANPSQAWDNFLLLCLTHCPLGPVYPKEGPSLSVFLAPLPVSTSCQVLAGYQCLPVGGGLFRLSSLGPLSVAI